MDEQTQAQFRAWVVARSPALLRTAYLLTGSRADAEDLLQTSLAKTYLAWGRIRDREAVDGYARRVMVNTQTSFWRRRRVDERPTGELPERGAGRDATADLDLHDALWTAVGRALRRPRPRPGRPLVLPRRPAPGRRAGEPHRGLDGGTPRHHGGGPPVRLGPGAVRPARGRGGGPLPPGRPLGRRHELGDGVAGRVRAGASPRAPAPSSRRCPAR